MTDMKTYMFVVKDVDGFHYGKDVLSHRFIFDDKFEAIDFMYVAKDMFKRYGYLSIADACEMLGKTSQYEQNLYGWDDTNFEVKIKHEGNDWISILPPTKSFVKELY